VSEMESRTAERIAAHGREALLDLLRPAFAREATARAEIVTVDRARLEQMVQDAAARADGVLWRRALAQVATVELRIGLAEAISHPAVQRAHELVGAPPYLSDRRPAADTDPPIHAAPAAPPARASRARTAPEVHDLNLHSQPEALQPLRMAAVHLSGIETVRQGQRDLELRFSDAGLDVLNSTSGVTIGRLEWDEIEALELPRSRRSLRPGRRTAQELLVRTKRGQANFELPGLTEQELRKHLEPMFARTQGR
jgi:hypothetical protein